MSTAATLEPTRTTSVDADIDLVEYYYDQGWTDGLPVVPPTREKIDAIVAALGGIPDHVECKIPPLPTLMASGTPRHR